jgi:hypothetical protein
MPDCQECNAEKINNSDLTSLLTDSEKHFPDPGGESRRHLSCGAGIR